MKTSDVIAKLELTVLAGNEHIDNEVSGGYCSDLLSDVMGNASEGDIWITLQSHKNIMAVAVLREVPAIILVKGIRPEEEVLLIADKEGIPVLSTQLSAFEIAGRLYQLLKSE